MPLNLFSTTVAKSDTGDLISLHTLYVFGPHAGEICTQSYASEGKKKVYSF